MAIEFFTENFRDEGYSSNLSSSFQGQLASSYTSALSSMLQTTAADWIGFLAHTVNNLSVSDALLVKQVVEQGAFSLSGLFGAAQTKDGSIANPADPEPKLTVTIGEGDSAHIVVIDLRAILSDLDTETWTQTDTTGGGKKAVTTTTTHVREFYTDADRPQGYDAGWSHDNRPPTVHSIDLSVTETQSQYDSAHHITNLDPANLVVKLLDPAKVSDPDGDAVAIVAGSVTLDGGSLPSWIKVAGDELIIDQNSRELDHYLAGQTDSIQVKYMVTDGEFKVENVVNIKITGTRDQYHASGSGSDSNIHDASGGNLNNQVLVIDEAALPSAGFDFSFTGSLNFSSTTIVSPEHANVSDSGDADWGAGAVQITDAASPITRTVDVAGALDDHQVDYNISFNGQTESGDTATVTLNYSYDYWYWA